ncbi:unnamed protein product [Sphenostylis stenocarpa]|uniref:Uncharacterized protein n=1 Tax=Sphenostylis stenocarpa TaxID=92480 RepID=A0AA86SEA8_9FABA|nr:unnamed protein product [Sphenostylis stenocarpa]
MEILRIDFPKFSVEYHKFFEDESLCLCQKPENYEVAWIFLISQHNFGDSNGEHSSKYSRGSNFIILLSHKRKHATVLIALRAEIQAFVKAFMFS